jgi:ElaB/YqjD/DUF883 family membrane-anchored ribosome-binding protein
VNDSISQARSQATEAKDKLAQDFRALATHADELLRTTAAFSGEGVAAARTRLNESLRAAREQLAHAQDYTLERSRQAVQEAESYVREKPWHAVAIAALAGLIVGMFCGAGAGRR